MSELQEAAWRMGRELDDAGPEARNLTLTDLDATAGLVAAHIEDVHYVGRHAESGGAAMGMGKRLVRSHLERRFVEQGVVAARFGDTIYRISEPREWQVLSWQKLWEFLTMVSLESGIHAGDLLGRLFAANQVRITGLDSVVALSQFSVDDMRHAGFVGRVLKTDRDGNKKVAELQVLPVVKAPKVLQQLDDGEMR